jgi:nitrite reductase/ring-hydroxylating ferredoxin subunit
MAESERLICKSSDLKNGGLGCRFSVKTKNNEDLPAFVIRFKDVVHGYINRCAHIPVQLDWREGAFFTSEEDLLICSTHGAIYEPGTGLCVGGPCKGASLQKLQIDEKEGAVYLLND